MKIKRTDFVKALKTVLDVIKDKEDVLIGTDSFIFTPDRVFAYNSIQTFSYPLETGLTCSIRASESLKVLQKMKGDELEIEEEENALKMSDGKTSLVMNFTEGDEDIRKILEKLEIAKIKWKKLPDNFVYAVKMCSASAGRDPYLQQLNGLAFFEDTVFSSDNFRIGRFKMKKSVGKEMWTLPTASVDMLLKMSSIPVEYCVQEDALFFKTDNGIVFGSQQLVDKFPLEKMSGIVNKFEALKLTAYTFPEGMEKGLERAEVFEYGERDELAIPHVIIGRKGKNLIVRGEKDIGYVEDKVAFKGKMFKEGMTIRMSPVFLRRILDVTREFNVIEDSNVAVFLVPDFIHIMTVTFK